MNKLPKNLRIKAGVIDTLGRIELGSDAVIMRQAADRISALEAECDALAAQVERLHEFALVVNRKCASYIMDAKRLDFEALGVAAYDAITKEPVQCLAEHDAEVAAKAIENLSEPLYASGKTDADIGEWLKQHASQIRQAAKGGE